MKTLDVWFAEYQDSHQNPVNKTIHYVCVPAIMWSVIGLFYGIKVSPTLPWAMNVGAIGAGAACLYYAALSKRLGLVMMAVVVVMLAGCYAWESMHALALWKLSLFVFALAWAGQFWGHKIEGKKPSFFKDVQFLLIGPLWVAAHVTGRLAPRA